MPTHADGLRLCFTFFAGGKRRDVSVKRWGAATALVLLLVTVVWSVLAGCYVVFHDRLVASLMSRQAEMQYGYEDRLATLRTELDRVTSRMLVDQRLIDTALQDLTVRSGRLEMRAKVIDKLVADGLPPTPHEHTVGTSLAPAGDSEGPIAPDPRQADAVNVDPQPSSLPEAPLRLGADGDHASLEWDAIAARLAALETRQLTAVTRFRDPLWRTTHRLTAALTAAGLSRRLLVRSGLNVGGPFVPLPASGLGTDLGDFEREVALTREALDQRAKLVALADKVPLRDPLDGPIEVSSTFGARVDPFLGRPALHTGIDLHETTNDVVHATAAGVVTIAGYNGGYGNMVEIDHGDGLVTRYAHLSAIDVSPRKRVSTGARIGRIGSTGRATGPHLHYETRVDGEPVDPATFLIAGSRLASD